MKLQTFLRGVLARWHLVQLAAKERDTQISVGVDTLKLNEGGSTLYGKAQIILQTQGSKWVQLWFLNVLSNIAAITCNDGLSHEATLLATLLLYRGSEEG